jgi:alpha-ketoglutarate-dependent taurine dioxygenase
MSRALLVAQRGVVCTYDNSLTLDWALIAVFRKQHTFDIEAHRALGAHFGPLHKHATYAVPRRGDLDDVVGESPAIHPKGS